MLTLHVADAGRGARNASVPAKRIAATALYLMAPPFDPPGGAMSAPSGEFPALLISIRFLGAAKLRHPHLPVLLDEVEVDLVAFPKLIRRQPALELCRVVPKECPLVSLFALDDHGSLDVAELLALHLHRLLDCLDADDLSFMRPLLGVA